MENVAEVLQTALGMERRGREYYLEALDRTSNPVIQSVLAALANDEEEHAMMISRYYTALERGQSWPPADGSLPAPKDAAARMDEILAGTVGNVGPDATYASVYQTARGFEEQSRDFYLSCEQSAGGTDIQGFFRFLVRLEDTHVHMLDILLDATKRGTEDK